MAKHVLFEWSDDFGAAVTVGTDGTLEFETRMAERIAFRPCDAARIAEAIRSGCRRTERTRPETLVLSEYFERVRAQCAINYGKGKARGVTFDGLLRLTGTRPWLRMCASELEPLVIDWVRQGLLHVTDRLYWLPEL